MDVFLYEIIIAFGDCCMCCRWCMADVWWIYWK